MQFVFDLDGTICFQGKPVSEKILTALANLEKVGGEVIFASARPIRDLLPVLAPAFHHHTLIGGNGALVASGKQLQKNASFELATLQSVMKLIEKYQASYLVDSLWDYAYTGPLNHPILQNVDPANLAHQVPLASLQSIVKILILSATDFPALEAELATLDLLVNRHYGESLLDLSPRGVHKFQALQSVGIEKNSYIAFGNDTNDISLFANSHYAVQIGTHEALAGLANEQILLVDDYEEKIVAKIVELQNRYLGESQ